MKDRWMVFWGCMGSAVAGAFGGWDASLTALIVTMAVDYLSGSLVALVFGKSSHTETGTYSSAYGFKGLCKKVMVLALVLLGARLDAVMGFDYIRDAVCIGFLANELMSIVENAGLMGLPLPKAVTQAIEQLKEKTE